MSQPATAPRNVIGRRSPLLSSRQRSLLYWAVTVPLAAELVAGGMTDVLHVPPFSTVLVQLGYPAYVGVILGVWKVLGAAAVLVPRLPRLKEWAYAGIVFDLTGAAASAFFMHSEANVVTPLAFLVLAMVSWACRPPSRKLPSS